jgi:hypothetical protein
VTPANGERRTLPRSHCSSPGHSGQANARAGNEDGNAGSGAVCLLYGTNSMWTSASAQGRVSSPTQTIWCCPGQWRTSRSELADFRTRLPASQPIPKSNAIHQFGSSVGARRHHPLAPRKGGRARTLVGVASANPNASLPEERRRHPLRRDCAYRLSIRDLTIFDMFVIVIQ